MFAYKNSVQTRFSVLLVLCRLCCCPLILSLCLLTWQTSLNTTTTDDDLVPSKQQATWAQAGSLRSRAAAGLVANWTIHTPLWVRWNGDFPNIPPPTEAVKVILDFRAALQAANASVGPSLACHWFENKIASCYVKP